MHWSRRLSRRVRVVLCLAAVVGCTWPTGAARAAAPARWAALADQIARSWAAQQNPDGTFADYVYGGRVSFCLQRSCAPGLGNARYGESALGYALLATGVREGDMDLVDRGLLALDYVVH